MYNIKTKNWILTEVKPSFKVILILVLCLFSGCSSEGAIEISDTLIFYPEKFLNIEPVGDQLIVSRYQGRDLRRSALFLYDPISDSDHMLSEPKSNWEVSLDYNQNNGLLIFDSRMFNDAIVTYNINTKEFSPLAYGDIPNWYRGMGIFGYVYQLNYILFQEIDGNQMGKIEIGEDKVINGFSLSPNGEFVAVGINDKSSQLYSIVLLQLDGFSVEEQEKIYEESYISWRTYFSWMPDNEVVIYFDRNQSGFIGYNLKTGCYSSPLLEEIISDYDRYSAFLKWEGSHLFVTGEYNGKYGVYQIEESDPLLENWLVFDLCP